MRVKAIRDKKKISKILNASATVTVHICMVTVAIVHLCTILHPLMWVFFLVKMCKMKGFFFFFCILQDFDVDALIHICLIYSIKYK